MKLWATIAASFAFICVLAIAGWRIASSDNVGYSINWETNVDGHVGAASLEDREHRYHHFRNENFWWGVSMGLGDRLLGTAPAVEDVGRSGTTATLGMRK